MWWVPIHLIRQGFSKSKTCIAKKEVSTKIGSKVGLSDRDPRNTSPVMRRDTMELPLGRP